MNVAVARVRAPTPLQVAVVNRHLGEAVGGSELQCELVARGLMARGHDVTYVAIGGPSQGRDDQPYRLRGVAAVASEIAAACRDLHPDVVYWRHGRRLLGPVARNLARVGIPVVLAVAHADDVARWPHRPWPHGARQRIGDARDRLRHRASFGALRRIAGVASQREDQLDAVRGRPARLVRNLVVATAARPSPRPHPRPYVAWVGNLKARKRPEVCRDLAAALEPVGVDVLMAGAVQDPAYADLARPDPGLTNLRHLGLLDADAVGSLLAGAICVPITYRPEGFSNVLLQAWTLGRATPSLGYDPDGLIASHDLGGVAGDDVARFVQMVRALVADPVAAAAAGARAAALVREHFDAAVALDALEDLLRSVVDADRTGVS